jgi:hypothetical protein
MPSVLDSLTSSGTLFATSHIVLSLEQGSQSKQEEQKKKEEATKKQKELEKQEKVRI